MNRLGTWMAFALLATVPVAAQERPAVPAEEAEELEPAVDTSAAPAPSEAAPATAGSPEEAPAAAPAPPPPTAGRRARDGAPDRIELEATQITGNAELPKVLYIVPWKRSDLGDLVGRPVNSLLDEVLMPVDRDVFRRENRYYRALRPGEGGGGNGAAAQPGTGPGYGPEK